MAISNPIIPFSFARHFQVLLVLENEKPSELWHTKQTPLTALHEIARNLGGLTLKLVTYPELQDKFSKVYGSNHNDAAAIADEVEESADLSRLLEDMPVLEDLLEVSDDAPVVRIINALFKQASQEGASDIHLEPFEKNSVVRFRVDGELRQIIETQSGLHAAFVSRIKIMARLDIAEKRLPQDGRISLRLGDKAIDIRVSTLPTSYGERVVMRLLEKDFKKLDLRRLGMSHETLSVYSQLIHKPHGIVLVTGPTGSGKTTTLYASLLSLQSHANNIMTVEDPVEYDLKGIGQTQVNPRIEMDFSRALRAILRQDPDIIMIGEIRDLETAQIAVQAALTGHLVLATLHTNDAASAITRLMDMGIEPFLLSSTLVGVLAQRLVRLTCSQCGSLGCPNCKNSGYNGRTGIYELMIVSNKLHDLIHDKTSETKLRETAIQLGMKSLQNDGERWVNAGKTTPQELLRVIGSVD